MSTHRTGARREPTAANRRVLEFANEHRFILAVHVAALLGCTPGAARRRLHRLVATGQMRSARVMAAAPWFQIDRPGLRAIASPLSRPREADAGTHRHDAALPWLWLAAQRGALGPVREVIAERRLRSEDGRPRPEAFREDRHGVRLGGAGPHGGDRLHYPDLVLVTGSGHRVAVELELHAKNVARRREIMGGYAFDGRVDAVLYLVEDPATGAAIERSAREAGIGDRVHVQRVAFASGADGGLPERAAERVATRPPALATPEAAR